MFNLSVGKPGQVEDDWQEAGTVYKNIGPFLQTHFFCWGIGSTVQKWCFSPTVQFTARLINILIDSITWIDK